MDYSNTKWDKRFLNLAKEFSTYSKDPSTQVGAIIVDRHGHVVGTGYNGFPKGIEDTKERYEDRETKYRLVVHAEVNAILQAGHAARGGILYVYPAFAFPPVCNECCKTLIQAGIVHIVGTKTDQDPERIKRWEESVSWSKIMCREAGIGWTEVVL